MKHHLFTPFKLKSITLKNRIVVSPMCQYSSKDGFANDWHFVHLATRAVGGAALIFAEAAAVSPEGRISPQDLGIWSDEHIPFLKKITSFMKEHDCIAGIQISHAGRKASTKRPWLGRGKIEIERGGWQPLAPSAISFSDEYHTPLALTKENIKKIIQDFSDAASRVREAGFEALEIHAAHGYLIHEFLSPLSNHRKDEYGGSFENRIRFLLEIIDAVKKNWPTTLPLFVRVSATDWAENGWDFAEVLKLTEKLRTIGADCMDVSSGGLVHHQTITNLGSGYQTAFAAEMRRTVDIAVGTVGLITSAQQADHIIRSNQADLVFLGRELLRNPYWPLQAAHELKHNVTWPVQYERGMWQ